MPPHTKKTYNTFSIGLEIVLACTCKTGESKTVKPIISVYIGVTCVFLSLIDQLLSNKKPWRFKVKSITFSLKCLMFGLR